MARRLKTIELPRSLQLPLAAGHPWVYRDHVPPDVNAKTGTWVEIRAGKFTGYALWDSASPVALRIFSQRSVPDAEWFEARVRQAWQLRAPLREGSTDAYRWINGEGDGLPGMVVDLYGGYAVLATYSESLDPVVEPVVNALRSVTDLVGVARRLQQGRKGERGGLQCLWGRSPPAGLVVQEHGVRMRAGLRDGQKTGLFLDQRENRRYVGALALGRSLLNLFSYTGGFSLHAALAGAARVTSVDVAPATAAVARDNFELNGLDPDSHEFVVADGFEYLERARQDRHRYDIVVTDPPSFAHGRNQVAAAVQAYTRLGRLALGVVAPGGWYVAASCTAQVSPAAFRDTLQDSARRAGRRLQIVHEAGQPLDHPVMAHHPEGRYLKLTVGRVLDPS
jgi:23S rRNA (cytosine1962-C5)-methyltransferase